MFERESIHISSIAERLKQTFLTHQNNFKIKQITITQQT